MNRFKHVLCCCITLGIIHSSDAQLLKKLKDKVDKAVGKNTTGDTNTPAPGTTGNSQTNAPRNQGNNGRNPSNRTGAGLISTPPDVKENLTSAEASFKTKNYGEARYAIQQAMLGVELEIGQKILKGLPSTVLALQKDTSADQVTSTGWGWAGMTIQRSYNPEDRNAENAKQLKVTIANNNIWMQAVNVYFTQTQTTGEQQNWKQVKVKGNRAVIEYDENTGYKLSLPLGQSSLLIFEGINFANEQEMLKAANLFDIDRIKKTLGEK